MDQELYGIVEFLIERAKTAINQGKIVDKIYWIMRYPDKPKLVYSPVFISPAFFMSPFIKFLPGLVQNEWDQRKTTNPQGSILEAVCALVSCAYNPKPDDPNYHKMNSRVLVASVHSTISIDIFQMFHSGEPGLVQFDNLERCPLQDPKGPATQLFPKL